MKTIVVYAHPGTDGFSSAMLERVKADLEERGIEHEIWDLYEMGYDSVLKKEEVYTAGNRKVSDENLKFQEKIGEASKLIFIYPVWWGGMPAILKGFIDRVFVPGFAFKYRKDKLLKFIPDGLLKDKTVICLVSSGGPWILYTLILNPVMIINKFVIFGFCGARTKTFQIYGATKLTSQKKRKIERVSKRAVNWMLRR